MATTGKIAATANNQDDGSYSDWTTPDNIHTDNTSVAVASGAGAGNTSYTFWDTFGFAGAGLESGDTVTDVVVELRGYDSASDGGWAFDVWWQDGTSTDPDAVTAAGTETRIPAAGDFGGTSGAPVTESRSLQGTQPTAAELLSANFQIMIGNANADNWPQEARIEYMTVEVTYTAAGGTSTPQGIQGMGQGINVQRSTRLGGELEQ